MGWWGAEQSMQRGTPERVQRRPRNGTRARWRDQRKQGRSASACRSSKEKSLVGRVVRSRILPQGDGAVREVQIEKLRGAQLRQN